MTAITAGHNQLKRQNEWTRVVRLWGYLVGQGISDHHELTDAAHRTVWVHQSSTSDTFCHRATKDRIVPLILCPSNGLSKLSGVLHRSVAIKKYEIQILNQSTLQYWCFHRKIAKIPMMQIKEPNGANATWENVRDRTTENQRVTDCNIRYTIRESKTHKFSDRRRHSAGRKGIGRNTAEFNVKIREETKSNFTERDL